VNVRPIVMKLWEVVEYTTAKISGTLHLGGLHYELGFTKTEIHHYRAVFCINRSFFPGCSHILQLFQKPPDGTMYPTRRRLEKRSPWYNFETSELEIIHLCTHKAYMIIYCSHITLESHRQRGSGRP